MLREEIETLINEWALDSNKTFRTYNNLRLDYIVLKRKESELFTCLPEKSTTDVGTVSKLELISLISNSIFVYERWLGDYTDLKTMRSKGCECGAHMTVNPEHHSYWCKLYKP